MTQVGLESSRWQGAPSRIGIYILFFNYAELEDELLLLELDLLDELLELLELLELDLLDELLELLELLELEQTLISNSMSVILNVPVVSTFNSSISNCNPDPPNVKSNGVPET